MTDGMSLESPFSTVKASAILVLSTLLAACHVTAGSGPTATSTTATSPVQAGPVIPKNEIEQITAQQIREKSGGGPIVITCPGDLLIKVGAHQKCILAQDGKRFDVTITITTTESPNDATWDWTVGKQLRSPS